MSAGAVEVLSDGGGALEPVVHEATPAAVAPLRPSSFVKPAAQLDELAEVFQAYQAIEERLLVPDDFQNINGKQFKKKSAWRKLGVAFNVSSEIVSVTHERNARGRIIRTEVHARAAAPNGRTQDGLGSCDVFEKCCDPKTCTRWVTYPDSGNPTGHVHCEPDCPGDIHFSHAQHDIPATAETRAKNRALSDLFGFGEVSAEEITNNDGTESPRAANTERQRAQQSAKTITTGTDGKGGQLKFVNDLLYQTDVQLTELTEVIGREVVSPTDLLFDEAKKVIEHLIAVRDGKKDRAPQPERRGPGATPTASRPAAPAGGGSAGVDLAPLGRAFRDMGIGPDERRDYVSRALGRTVPEAWGVTITAEDLQTILGFLKGDRGSASTAAETLTCRDCGSADISDPAGPYCPQHQPF